MKKGQRKQGICLLCKKSYYKYRKNLKYCSRECSSKRRKNKINQDYKEKLKVRIKEKSQLDLLTGCWVWLKYKDKLGRGYCHFNNTTILAHRASFIAFKENIPEGMVICHKCDNYSCVNPKHLFLGTQIDNVNDRQSKNRGIRGEKVAKSKLKEYMILEIRELYKNGMSQEKIAKKYNIVQSAISLILRKKTWKHVK